MKSQFMHAVENIIGNDNFRTFTDKIRPLLYLGESALKMKLELSNELRKIRAEKTKIEKEWQQ